MRIFFITDVIPRVEDAQITHTKELFNAFGLSNTAVLFAPRTATDLYGSAGVHYLYAGRIPVLSSIFYQILVFFAMIRQASRGNNPDIIYVRHSIYTLAPLVVARILNVPYYVEINGLILDQMVIKGDSRIAQFFASLSETLNYRHANRIIAVTQGIKKEIASRYGITTEKILVIENGVNTSTFHPIIQKDAQGALGLPKDRRIICFVGALHPWQGVEFVLKSLPEIRNLYPNVLFLIVGNGPLYGQLKKQVSDEILSDIVVFTGRVPFSQIPLYINAAEICLAPKIPIKSGYSPLKLYEYMACARPVIASNTAGFEILEKIGGGVLVDPKNSKDLTGAIDRLLQNPDLMQQMGRNGRDYVEKYSSWTRVANRIISSCKSTSYSTPIKKSE